MTDDDRSIPGEVIPPQRAARTIRPRRTGSSCRSGTGPRGHRRRGIPTKWSSGRATLGRSGVERP